MFVKRINFIGALTLIDQPGGKITPQPDLFNAIPASYGIYRNALVTFPRNGLATKWCKNFTPITIRDWNMVAGTWKKTWNFIEFSSVGCNLS